MTIQGLARWNLARRNLAGRSVAGGSVLARAIRARRPASTAASAVGIAAVIPTAFSGVSFVRPARQRSAITTEGAQRVPPRDQAQLWPAEPPGFQLDETLSDMLGAVFEVTSRQRDAPVLSSGELLVLSVRVLDSMRSEYQCEGWLEDCLLTGWPGLASRASRITVSPPGGEGLAERGGV